MKKKTRNLFGLVSVFALVFLASGAHAAKPAGKGGSSETTTATSGTGPEFYSTIFDYASRTMTLNGIHFITDNLGAPVLPDVTIGGQLIDPASGSCTDPDGVCPLTVDFEEILTKLVGPRISTEIRALPGGVSYEIKVAAKNPDSTPAGTAFFTSYFARQIKDLPVDTGACPCAEDYAALYKTGSVLADTVFCSEAEDILASDYIEAGYADTTSSIVIIGSHSSSSPEPLYAGTCYVRDLTQIIDGEEVPTYLGGPIDLTDSDHNNYCVPLIRSLESACSTP